LKTPLQYWRGYSLGIYVERESEKERDRDRERLESLGCSFFAVSVECRCIRVVERLVYRECKGRRTAKDGRER
jgi:hypothetical protein